MRREKIDGEALNEVIHTGSKILKLFYAVMVVLLI